MRATVFVLPISLLATRASAQSGGTALAAATGPTMAATKMVHTPQREFAGFGFNPRSQAPPIDP